MSCEQCRDIEEKDGVIPPCKPSPLAVQRDIKIPSPLAGEGEGEGGCPIPPLTPDEQRILEMRSLLVSLAELHIGGEILRMYGATKEDLEMLAIVEEELKENKQA